MPGSASLTPDFLPVLSRGRHRNSRMGACFMEMASVLAGERWSDHPRCTHPLLADLAQRVNDRTSDEQRHHLATLIPAVVGLTGDHWSMDARIALRCATTALPVAPADLQNALAVCVLTADSALAVLAGKPAGSLEPRSAAALDAAPDAAQWARAFAHQAGVTARGIRRQAAPSAVRVAVRAIAEGAADPDLALRQLLADVIDDCRAVDVRVSVSRPMVGAASV
ncbi:MAG: hypothetical protein M3O55_09640 [Actinomycetota bacterium]|nr:hypothetical protein [Actinomycetota bacterium]